MCNIIASIDYSISCICICIANISHKLCFENCNFYFNQEHVSQKELKRRKSLSFSNIFWSPRILTNSLEERYYVLADWALSICLENKISVAVLEAYALGAKGRTFDIAEATGLLKHYFYRNNIPIILITPTKNKKTFSGKGNAGKSLMIDTFNKRNGMNISEHFGYPKEFIGSPISDIVDCYSLFSTAYQNFQLQSN